MRAKAVSGIIFVVAFGFTMCSSLVRAASESLWVNTALPTKSLQQSNVTSDIDDKFCQHRSEEELQYKPDVTNPSSWIFKQRTSVQGCWYETEYGLLGTTSQRTYLSRSQSNGPVVRVDNPFYHLLYPVGKTNKLVGVYTVGSQRNMYMYEDVAQAFELRSAGDYEKYVVKPDAVKWNLTYPGTNQNLPMMRVASSENGKWLIVEATGGFLRIDTDTKDILTFEKSLYSYGSGSDPTYDLAISNDGRYAVIAGGNVTDRTNLIYDLSSCVPVAHQPLGLSTGCGKRTIKPELFPELSVSQAAQRFIFHDDGASMTADAISNGQWNRYAITAPGQDYHGLSYLALGDSYSSGEGEYPGSGYYMRGTDGDGANELGFTTTIAGFPYGLEKCHLSTRSYPYELAKRASLTSIHFRSVACSGSIENDITDIRNGNPDERYNGRFGQLKAIEIDNDARDVKNQAVVAFTPGRAAQIEFVKTYKPRVVSVGIGGNDIGFGEIIKKCLEPGTCPYVTDLREVTGRSVQALYGDLMKTYRALHDASSETRYYVIGYPQIFGEDNQSCPLNVRFNESERIFARQLVSYLNTVIRTAANDAGFTYIDIENSLVGRELCNSSGQDSAMNGLNTGDDYEINILGKEYLIFGQETYHPNPLGHGLIANEITNQLQNESIVSYRPCGEAVVCTSNLEPSPPGLDEYFTSYQPHAVDNAKETKLFVDTYLQVNGSPALQPGSVTQVNGAINSDNTPDTGLMPQTNAAVGIYSEFRSLGNLQIDADGILRGELTIPTDISTGYHTLVVEAIDRKYQRTVYYQSIVIYSSRDDVDGDGIPNSQDTCEFVTPSGTDMDGDGIDDACDGMINVPADTIQPVVTATIDTQPSSDGWFNHDVTISWQATDETTQQMSQPPKTHASIEGENTYYSDEVCDDAGNCTRGEVTLGIDKSNPEVGDLTWDINPKKVSESAQLRVDVGDSTSGVKRVEYLIGDSDPGQGKGASMVLHDTTASVTHGSDFGSGVYKISVRAMDEAGNWSPLSIGYLVVYDPTTGVKLRGVGTTKIEPVYGTTLPWLYGPTSARVGFIVRYNSKGLIARDSDFRFSYRTGEHCLDPRRERRCHSFVVDATAIQWLTISGQDQSTGTFQASARLKRDSVTEPVIVIVEVTDGTRLAGGSRDTLKMTIYPSTGAYTVNPLYSMGPVPISRGDIKISF